MQILKLKSKIQTIRLCPISEFWIKLCMYIAHWESCQLSATYNLWLKAESWSLSFEIWI